MTNDRPKPGYKQTEVGVIPEDWDVASLANLTQAKRPISYGIVQTGRQVPGGVFCIRVVDIVNGRINNDDLITTSQEISNSYKRTILNIGDLIIALRGKIGELAVVPKELKGTNLTRGVALIALQENYSSHFYHQYLSSAGSKIRLQNSLNGSALQELPIATLRSFPVAVPPLPEQRSIAQALSDVDALIAALEKAIAKKRAIKTATMQQLLKGKKRLPGFGGEWQKIKMSTNASLKARIGWQALTTEEYLDSGSFFLVTGTDFVKGRVNWNTCHFVDEWRYSQDKNIQLRNGDVLLTKDGTIGKVGYVDHITQPATLNSGVFVIRPVNGCFDPLFLYYILSSQIFDEFLNKIFAGSTISHLYQKDFVTFEFLAPTIQEQRAIATVLSDMDTEIAALETRIAKTQALKQGMMQALLTGRVRLV